MPETIEICRSRALSEEYRDFIFNMQKQSAVRRIPGFYF